MNNKISNFNLLILKRWCKISLLHLHSSIFRLVWTCIVSTTQFLTQKYHKIIQENIDLTIFQRERRPGDSSAGGCGICVSGGKKDDIFCFDSLILDGFCHVSPDLHNHPDQPANCHDVWHIPEDPATVRYGMEVWIFKTYHVSFNFDSWWE